MRLGIAKNLKHASAEEWARRHSELGLRAVTCPLDIGACGEQILEYRRAAEAHDLLIAEVGVWRSVVCDDPRIRAENIDYAVAKLRLADEIGARCCVNYIGTYRGVGTELSPSNMTDEAFFAAVDAVREIIRRAAPSKTKFVIEGMRKMTPYSPEDYLRLYKAVDMPSFGVHLDPFNWISTPDELANSGMIVDQAFDLLGDKILSCHMKDLVPDGDGVKEVPTLTGEFDIARYLARLADHPDMPVIIEHLETTDEYLAAVARFAELDTKLGGIM